MGKRKRREIEEPDPDNESAPKKRPSQTEEDEGRDFEEEAEPTQEGDGEAEQVEQDFDDGWRHPTGRIEYVKMQNFMCHAHFVYKPTGRINFLSGANGSGKSAILAALLFGLGGNARLSNRGSANRNFIRTDQPSASVEISLFNRGEEAYKKGLYGNSIIIHRTVTVNGGGSYKLKNDKGKVVMDKRVKEELERIKTCYNIQIDNPIALLNQDTAKTFLFKCQPDKLYDFFMRATQLKDCEEIYTEAEMNIKNAKIDYKKKLFAVKEILKKVREWKKKFDFHQSMATKRADLEGMKKELACAEFQECREEINVLENALEKVAGDIATCKESIDKLTDEKLAFKQEKSSIEAQLKQMENVSEDRVKELANMRALVRQVKDEYRKYEKAVDALEKNKNEKHSKFMTMNALISKLRSSSDDDEQARNREKLLAKISSLEEEKANCEARYKSTQTHADNLKHTLDITKEKERAVSDEIQSAKHSIQSLQRQMKNVKDQGENRLVLFGDSMPRIVADIHKNKRRFHKLPIGPLGMEMQLKPNVSKEKAVLIEHEIGPLFSAFVVDNFDDRKVLAEIAKYHWRGRDSINIIVNKFTDQVHDVSHGRCQSSQFSTIMDLLEITSPMVMNVLIDHKKIERVLLMERDSEAQDILSSTRKVPKNCVYAYTLDMNQFYPAPNYRSYFISPKSKGILQSSMADHINSMAHDIINMQKTSDGLKEELRSYQEESKRHEMELQKANQTRQESSRKVTLLCKEIFKLNQQTNDEKPPDLTALEDDAERVQEEIQEIEQEQRKMQSELAEEKEKLTALRNEAKNLEREVEDSNVENELREKLANCDQCMEKKDEAGRSIQQKVQKKKAKKNAIEERLKEGETRQEKFQLKIIEIFGSAQPEMLATPVEKKSQIIKKELFTLEESFRREEEVVESKEVVNREYFKVNDHYHKLKSNMLILEHLLLELNDMSKAKREKFQLLRACMSRMVKTSFSTHLQQRQFNGLLKFDHKLKRLDIQVSPEEDEFLTLKRDVKTLSGGEKSYSTVSLVLALWECIEPPFRILDEFDVFMDSINRKSALSMMIQFAQSQRRHQYVFLTPLTLNNLEQSEDVSRVHLQKTDGS